MPDFANRIRARAGAFAGVDEGTACTQASFKRGKTAFLFIGEQGGRNKAMVKLNISRAEATALATAHPEDFQVGTGAWVTFRFDRETPELARVWERWLGESYALSDPKR